MKKNKEEHSIKTIFEAVYKGESWAQLKLGLICEDKQDYTEAFRWYMKAAEQKVAKAQYKIGEMYANGYGVKQDDFEAVTWLKLAAKQGDKEADFLLYKIYIKTRMQSMFTIRFCGNFIYMLSKEM